MMKRINYKKRAVIHGLSMAVFLGACLGLQANDQDKAVSAQATVNTDRSATLSTDRNETDKLSQRASQKGVNLAKDMEPKHTDMIKDMEGKQGADFDRAFIEHAIKDHRKDIAKFERASRDLSDSELKAFATETLPTLRH